MKHRKETEREANRRARREALRDIRREMGANVPTGRIRRIDIDDCDPYIDPAYETDETFYTGY